MNTRLTGSAFQVDRVLVRPVSQPGPVRGGQRDLPVHACGRAASVELRHPADTDQRVRPAPQHQFLQGPDLSPVPGLRRLEDPLPKPPYVVLMDPPVSGVPVEEIALRSVHFEGRHRHRERVSRHRV